MGQRGQVAGGAYRAFLWHQRRNVLINMPEDAFQRGGCDAGIALCQRLRFGDEHEPGYFFRNAIAHAYTMALQDVILQSPGIFLRDPGIAQGAKAGIDTVYYDMPGHNGLYVVVAGFDLVKDFGCEDRLFTASGYIQYAANR